MSNSNFDLGRAESLFGKRMFTEEVSIPDLRELYRLIDLHRELNLEPNDDGDVDWGEIAKSRDLEREHSVLWIKEACFIFEIDEPKWLKGLRLEAMLELYDLASYATATLPRKERHLRDLYSQLRLTAANEFSVQSRMRKAGELIHLYENLYFAIRDIFASKAYSRHIVFCVHQLTRHTKELERDLDFPKNV